MKKTRRSRRKTLNKSDNEIDSDLENQLKTQEETISKKENIKFLSVLSGKKDSKLASASKQTAVSDSESEIEPVQQKKRQYKRKEPEAEEICDQFIANFKKENDLKINNYFRLLNENVKSGLDGLSKNVADLVKFLKYNSTTGK